MTIVISATIDDTYGATDSVHAGGTAPSTVRAYWLCHLIQTRLNWGFNGWPGAHGENIDNREEGGIGNARIPCRYTRYI